jgi:uncharacterized short protein YbdD (DUF466 family)
MSWVRGFWRWLRAVSGDDAYEQYLAHHADRHAGTPALGRRAFYVEREARKWNGVNRCC